MPVIKLLVEVNDVKPDPMSPIDIENTIYAIFEVRASA
jgi:hypothetical protein